MLIWGGLAGDGEPVGGGGLYDPSQNTWSAVSTNGAPSARSGAAWGQRSLDGARAGRFNLHLHEGHGAHLQLARSQ